MSKGKLCVEPKIGKRIGEYNDDATQTAGKTRRLPVEEKFMFEAHLIRCPFCRKKLNLRARMNFETTLVLSGFFLENPVLVAKRREAVQRFFGNEMSFNEPKDDWLKVSREEYERIKSFMGGDC